MAILKRDSSAGSVYFPFKASMITAFSRFLSTVRSMPGSFFKTEMLSFSTSASNCSSRSCVQRFSSSSDSFVIFQTVARMNCLVHRDYSFSGSTIVNIYDDRIEFVSLGGAGSRIRIRFHFPWSFPIKKSESCCSVLSNEID